MSNEELVIYLHERNFLVHEIADFLDCNITFVCEVLKGELK